MNNLSKISLLIFTAGLTLCLCSMDVMAQPGRGRGGPGGGGPGFGRRGGGATGGAAGLLRREDVRKELELTDEQLEDLQSMNQERGGFDRRALREEMEGLSDEERRERFMEIRNERETEIKEKLGEILLPFQVKRLEQISNQAASRGGSRSLLNGRIAEKLKITDEQKDRIREKAEKLQKEFEAKLEKMRKTMQEEILEELSSSQRKEYEEMMGEEFKFEGNDRQAGFGRDRGGRRGRGGDRGGREDRRRPETDDFDATP